jgi:hypothetical protein|tara:strand:- start:6332 stop:6721 length:390 start_codon:yes stop_codon:yes gene_type:complete
MKILIFLAWAAITFIPGSEAIAAKDKPFAQVVPMQVLCTEGGPEYLILELMEKYNEVPAYTMEISVDRPMPIAMIITENKNNPSSTVILANPNLGVSCIFMTAKDSLLATEAESLPAKQPSEEGPKIGT